MGTGSGLPSGSGIQSENSAFSAYLRDSRMQPSKLYIPDSFGDTLAARTTTWYGHLNTGHEASVVKIVIHSITQTGKRSTTTMVMCTFGTGKARGDMTA